MAKANPRTVPGLDAGVQVKLKVASSLYLYAEPKIGIRTDTYDGSEQGRPDRVTSMVGGLLFITLSIPPKLTN